MFDEEILLIFQDQQNKILYIFQEISTMIHTRLMWSDESITLSINIFVITLLHSIPCIQKQIRIQTSIIKNY